MELEDTPSSMAIAGRSPRLHQCNHLTSDFTQDAFDSNAEVACNAVDEHNNSIRVVIWIRHVQVRCRCSSHGPRKWQRAVRTEHRSQQVSTPFAEPTRLAPPGFVDAMLTSARGVLDPMLVHSHKAHPYLGHQYANGPARRRGLQPSE